MDTGEPAKHRGPSSQNGEERLCDQIAAEILMLSLAFEEDGWLEDWSIRGVSALARKYDTSITATARRMIDLMPEKALM